MALTHGMARTPEYRAYIDAKRRCENPNSQTYEYYGGRGVEFRFADFVEFFEAIGERPSSDYSIDRIDNEGHYEAGNVRWATKKEQIHNRRGYEKPWLMGNTSNAKSYQVVHPSGKVENIVNMAEFCRTHGLSKSQLHSTIKNNWKHRGYKAVAI